MRFDLEIPATNNVELTFIKDGKAISNSLVPLVYCKTDTYKSLPEDYISVGSNYLDNARNLFSYESSTGPLINNIKGSKFLLTNKLLYSDGNTKTPLFYSHTIQEPLSGEAIRIVDYYGVMIPKNKYLVDTSNSQTNIYLNKTDQILFVEYVSNISTKRELINLIPVFIEASWEDLNNNNISPFKYIINGNTIETSHAEDLFITYLHETNLVRNVKGNIEDRWYIGILNIDLIENGLRYWIPEFYVQQQSDTTQNHRVVEQIKCVKVFDNFIKTQYPISDTKLDSVYIYIKDRYTNELKYALTSNVDLEGTLYSGIPYGKITSLNRDGLIQLPITLTDDNICFSTIYTNEDYFEYKGIDLKSSLIHMVDFVLFYVLPNKTENETSVRHALIGGSNGEFSSEQEFISAYPDVKILGKACGLNNLENNGMEFIDLNLSDIYLDKLNACKTSKEVLLNDINSGEIKLPGNDTIVAIVNYDELSKIKEIEITKDSISKEYSINEYGLYFIDKIKSTFDNSINVSTKTIIEINNTTET